MPAADTVLLPICVGLALLGVIVTGVAWRRGNKGRVIQGIGLALAPIALYFTGLLRILWDFVVSVVGWAGRLVFSPTVWFGAGLLGICIVLWVVGGLVARRSTAKAVASGGSVKAVGGRPAKSSGTSVAKTGAPPVDEDFAEIEALLKKRGIE
jgi:hypothetical protein